MARNFDFIVVGGGAAGASAAYFLSQHGKVAVLEQEAQPGYHSTGRSAAVLSSAYGHGSWQSLTTASLTFFEAPPDGFSDTPLTRPLGALYLAQPHEEAALRAQAHDLARRKVGHAVVTTDEAAKLSPCVRMEPFSLGLYEPGCVDLDAAAILQGFLRRARARGAELIVNAEARAIRRQAGIWYVETGKDTYAAPLLVNAAGGWVDEIAARAGLPRRGVVPHRRTAITFAPPPGHDVRRWLMTFDLAETWYFKPEGGNVMMSPADAIAMPPGDAQPEEFDIAVAIDRIETVTTMTVGRPLSRWAGQRTFAADHEAVIGPDPLEPSFIWYAGQGGNGVMACPAAAELCAALSVGQPVPARLAALGITAGQISPARLTALGG